MQYLLMIIADESKPMPAGAELANLQRAYLAFTREVAQSGRLRGGAPLLPSRTATTVREQAGKRQVADGPHTDSKHQLAGFYLVECANLDEAIAIAGRVPALRQGESVEVRPLAPMPEGA
jgi:hypothetical protein